MVCLVLPPVHVLSLPTSSPCLVCFQGLAHVGLDPSIQNHVLISTPCKNLVNCSPRESHSSSLILACRCKSPRASSRLVLGHTRPASCDWLPILSLLAYCGSLSLPLFTSCTASTSEADFDARLTLACGKFASVCVYVYFSGLHLTRVNAIVVC